MKQRVALVTGGTGGIGTAICKELSDQGRLVVAGYIEAEHEQAGQWQVRMRGQGYDVHTVAGDVTCFESAERMVEEVRARFGNIGILVNCAGITRDKTFAKMDLRQWREVIDTNLNSLFNVTRRVVEQMAENRFGRVVNISSVNGQKGQFGQTNYAAAKAGVHGFSMSLAQELARKGITVNTVAPGYVETPMTLALPDNLREAIIDLIPLGRMAKPEEVANTVGFLCQDESAYITGARIPINGGMYMS